MTSKQKFNSLSNEIYSLYKFYHEKALTLSGAEQDRAVSLYVAYEGLIDYICELECSNSGDKNSKNGVDSND